MINGPLQLFGSHQDLAEDSIHSRLAAIETCCPDNEVLLIEDEPAESQHAYL